MSKDQAVNLLDLTKVVINTSHPFLSGGEEGLNELEEEDDLPHSRPTSTVSAPGKLLFSSEKHEQQRRQRYLEDQENRYTREMYLSIAVPPHSGGITTVVTGEDDSLRSNSVTSLGNVSDLSGESAFADSVNSILKAETGEDTSSVDYSQLDRYGFIIVNARNDGETESKPSPAVEKTSFAKDKQGVVDNDEEKKEQERRGLREARRAIKWVEMLRDMEATLDERQSWPRKVPKFESRLVKGIPECLRTKVWALFLGFARPTTPINYRELYLRISGFERQIDLDIERTLRDHILFKARFSSAQVSLFKILVAYSNYDSEVGYCQGMSTIAAFLLLYFEEEMAFTVLQRLMSELRGLFTTGFPLLFETFFVQEELMRKYLPAIYARLESCHVTTSVYATKWYLTLFLGFPFPIATRIWDLFLFYGLDILVCVALALLKLHQAQLLCKDYDHLMQFLSRLPEMPLDEQAVIRTTWKIWRKINPHYSDSSSNPSHYHNCRNIFQRLRLRYGKLDVSERRRHHHR